MTATVICQKNTGPPAEVKMYGSKFKAHDANYLKRIKKIQEKTRNHYSNVTAASSGQLFSHERCSNNEKNFLNCHQKYSNF